MRQRPSENPESNTAFDKLLNFINSTYERFIRFVSINDDDPMALLFLKVLMRLVGGLILLALSPIIILSLLIAILTVV